MERQSADFALNYTGFLRFLQGSERRTRRSAGLKNIDYTAADVYTYANERGWADAADYR